MHTMMEIIVKAMMQDCEEKCEVVGQGSFALPKTCFLSADACVCQGAMVSRGNTDVTTVVWPAAGKISVKLLVQVHLPCRTPVA